MDGEKLLNPRDSDVTSDIIIKDILNSIICTISSQEDEYKDLYFACKSTQEEKEHIPEHKIYIPSDERRTIVLNDDNEKQKSEGELIIGQQDSPLSFLAEACNVRQRLREEEFSLLTKDMKNNVIAANNIIISDKDEEQKSISKESEKNQVNLTVSYKQKESEIQDFIKTNKLELKDSETQVLKETDIMELNGSKTLELREINIKEQMTSETQKPKETDTLELKMPKEMDTLKLKTSQKPKEMETLELKTSETPEQKEMDTLKLKTFEKQEPKDTETLELKTSETPEKKKMDTLKLKTFKTQEPKYSRSAMQKMKESKSCLLEDLKEYKTQNLKESGTQERKKADTWKVKVNELKETNMQELIEETAGNNVPSENDMIISLEHNTGDSKIESEETEQSNNAQISVAQTHTVNTIITKDKELCFEKDKLPVTIKIQSIEIENKSENIIEDRVKGRNTFSEEMACRPQNSEDNSALVIRNIVSLLVQQVEKELLENKSDRIETNNKIGEMQIDSKVVNYKQEIANNKSVDQECYSLSTSFETQKLLNSKQTLVQNCFKESIEDPIDFNIDEQNLQIDLTATNEVEEDETKQVDNSYDVSETDSEISDNEDEKIFKEKTSFNKRHLQDMSANVDADMDKVEQLMNKKRLLKEMKQILVTSTSTKTQTISSDKKVMVASFLNTSCSISTSHNKDVLPLKKILPKKSIDKTLNKDKVVCTNRVKSEISTKTESALSPMDIPTLKTDTYTSAINIDQQPASVLTPSILRNEMMKLLPDIIKELAFTMNKTGINPFVKTSTDESSQSIIPPPSLSVISKKSPPNSDATPRPTQQQTTNSISASQKRTTTGISTSTITSKPLKSPIGQVPLKLIMNNRQVGTLTGKLVNVPTASSEINSHNANVIDHRGTLLQPLQFPEQGKSQYLPAYQHQKGIIYAGVPVVPLKLRLDHQIPIEVVPKAKEGLKNIAPKSTKTKECYQQIGLKNLTPTSTKTKECYQQTGLKNLAPKPAPITVNQVYIDPILIPNQTERKQKQHIDSTKLKISMPVSSKANSLITSKIQKTLATSIIESSLNTSNIENTLITTTTDSFDQITEAILNKDNFSVRNALPDIQKESAASDTPKYRSTGTQTRKKYWKNWQRTTGTQTQKKNLTMFDHDHNYAGMEFAYDFMTKQLRIDEDNFIFWGKGMSSEMLAPSTILAVQDITDCLKIDNQWFYKVKWCKYTWERSDGLMASDLRKFVVDFQKNSKKYEMIVNQSIQLSGLCNKEEIIKKSKVTVGIDHYKKPEILTAPSELENDSCQPADEPPVIDMTRKSVREEPHETENSRFKKTGSFTREDRHQIKEKSTEIKNSSKTTFLQINKKDGPPVKTVDVSKISILTNTKEQIKDINEVDSDNKVNKMPKFNLNVTCLAKKMSKQLKKTENENILKNHTKMFDGIDISNVDKDTTKEKAPVIKTTDESNICFQIESTAKRPLEEKNVNQEPPLKKRARVIYDAFLTTVERDKERILKITPILLATEEEQNHPVYKEFDFAGTLEKAKIPRKVAQQQETEEKCRYCETTLKGTLAVTKHNKLYSKCKCPQCGVRICSRMKLRKHIISHTKHSFQCHICLKAFQAREVYKIHKQESHTTISISSDNNEAIQQQQNTIWDCITCKKQFKTLLCFIKHKKKYCQDTVESRKETAKTHKCIVCDKIFKRRQFFDIHVKFHQNKALIIDSGSSDLIQLGDTFDFGGEKNIKEVSSKNSAKRRRRRKNSYTKSLVTKRKKYCMECLKGFKDREGFYQHINTKKCPYLENNGQCMLCKKFFHSLDNLKVHVTNCFKESLTALLKPHSKSSNGQESPSKTRAVYHCPHCKTMFPSIFAFNRHKLLFHSKKVRHQCQKCLFKCYSRNLLKRHIKRKLCPKIDTFPCFFCDQNRLLYPHFGSILHLVQHLKTHKVIKTKFVPAVKVEPAEIKNEAGKTKLLTFSKSDVGKLKGKSTICTIPGFGNYEVAVKPITGDSFQVIACKMIPLDIPKNLPNKDSFKTSVKQIVKPAPKKTNKNSIKCFACPLVFDHVHDTLKHFRRFHEYRFVQICTCSICKIAFKDEEFYSLHMRKQHQGVPKHKMLPAKVEETCEEEEEEEHSPANITGRQWNVNLESPVNALKQLKHQQHQQLTLAPSDDMIEINHLFVSLYTCQECGTPFIRTADLKEHYCDAHSMTPEEAVQTPCTQASITWPCCFCKKSMIDVFFHAKQHTNIMLECYQCNVKVTNKSTLVKHIEKVHTREWTDEDNHWVQAVIFSAVQDTIRLMYKLRNGENTKPYTNLEPKAECNKCHSIFYDQNTVERHKSVVNCRSLSPNMIVSKVKESTYTGVYTPCPLCFTLISTLRDVVTHLFNYHEIAKMYLTLDEPRTIISRTPLHCVEDEINTCDVCDLRFKNEHAMWKDMFSHVDMNVEMCSICKDTFPNDYSLLMHTFNSHRTFLCRVCNKGIHSIEELYNHCQLHVLEVNVPRDEKGKMIIEIDKVPVFSRKKTRLFPLERMDFQRFYISSKIPKDVLGDNNLYYCKVCHKNIEGELTFIVHMKTHPLCRRLLCFICKKTFIEEEDLKNHMTKHGTDFNTEFEDDASLEEIPDDTDICSYCSQVFVTKNLLNKHLDEHKIMMLGHDFVKGNKMMNTVCRYIGHFNGNLTMTADNFSNFIEWSVDWKIAEASGLQNIYEFLRQKLEGSNNLLESHDNKSSQIKTQNVGKTLNNKNKTSTCPDCLVVMDSPLELHRRGHVHDTCQLKCAYCTKRFEDRDLLITHMFKHVGQLEGYCGFDIRKPIVCQYCNIETSQEHMKRHHKGLQWNTNKIRCPFCSLVFQKRSFATHLEKKMRVTPSGAVEIIPSEPKKEKRQKGKGKSKRSNIESSSNSKTDLKQKDFLPAGDLQSVCTDDVFVDSSTNKVKEGNKSVNKFRPIEPSATSGTMLKVLEDQNNNEKTMAFFNTQETIELKELQRKYSSEMYASILRDTKTPTCKICDWEFNAFGELKIHVFKHALLPDPALGAYRRFVTCHLCMGVVRKTSIKTHLALKHDKEIMNHKRERRKYKPFTTKPPVEIASKSVEKVVAKEIKLKSIGKASTKSNIKSPNPNENAPITKLIENSLTKPDEKIVYPCIACDKTYLASSRYLNHVRAKHPWLYEMEELKVKTFLQQDVLQLEKVQTENNTSLKGKRKISEQDKKDEITPARKSSSSQRKKKKQRKNFKLSKEFVSDDDSSGEEETAKKAITTKKKRNNSSKPSLKKKKEGFNSEHGVSSGEEESVAKKTKKHNSKTSKRKESISKDSSGEEESIDEWEVHEEKPKDKTETKKKRNETPKKENKDDDDHQVKENVKEQSKSATKKASKKLKNKKQDESAVAEEAIKSDTKEKGAKYSKLSKKYSKKAEQNELAEDKVESDNEEKGAKLSKKYIKKAEQNELAEDKVESDNEEKGAKLSKSTTKKATRKGKSKSKNEASIIDKNVTSIIDKNVPKEKVSKEELAEEKCATAENTVVAVTVTDENVIKGRPSKKKSTYVMSLPVPGAMPYPFNCMVCCKGYFSAGLHLSHFKTAHPWLYETEKEKIQAQKEAKKKEKNTETKPKDESSKTLDDKHKEIKSKLSDLLQLPEDKPVSDGKTKDVATYTISLQKKAAKTVVSIRETSDNKTESSDVVEARPEITFADDTEVKEKIETLLAKKEGGTHKQRGRPRKIIRPGKPPSAFATKKNTTEETSLETNTVIDARRVDDVEATADRGTSDDENDDDIEMEIVDFQPDEIKSDALKLTGDITKIEKETDVITKVTVAEQHKDDVMSQNSDIKQEKADSKNVPLEEKSQHSESDTDNDGVESDKEVEEETEEEIIESSSEDEEMQKEDNKEKVRASVSTYPCYECSALFYTESDLAEHNLLHGKSTDNQEDKKIPKSVSTYPCKFCSALFYTESDLAEHLPLHQTPSTSGGGHFKVPYPLVCIFCGYGFYKRSPLKCHLMSKHKNCYTNELEKSSSFVNLDYEGDVGKVQPTEIVLPKRNRSKFEEVMKSLKPNPKKSISEGTPPTSLKIQEKMSERRVSGRKREIDERVLNVLKSKKKKMASPKKSSAMLPNQASEIYNESEDDDHDTQTSSSEEKRKPNEEFSSASEGEENSTEEAEEKEESIEVTPGKTKYKDRECKYVCKYCDHLFSSKANMGKHIKHHFKGAKLNQLTCVACFCLIEKHELKWHMHTSHEDIKLSQKKKYCTHCNFSSKKSLEKHIFDVHPSLLKIECRICDARFSTTSSYNEHFQMTHGKSLDEDALMCLFCNKKFQSLTKLYCHFSIVHMKKNKNLYCALCSKYFYGRTDLENHQDEFHKNDKYQCGLCMIDFESVTACEKHVLVHKTKSDHQCTVCKFYFESSEGLTKHSETCDRSFKKVSEYQSHNSSTNVSCVKCDQSFDSELELIEHMKTHSMHKSFQCTSCEKHFNSQNETQAHMDRVHQGGGNKYHTYEKQASVEETDGETERPLAYSTDNQCDICGENFIRHEIYIEHVKRHEKHF